MKKRGFTLIELLVVVLIIGILTAAAVPMYEKATRKAQFVQVQSTLTAMMREADAYAMENAYDNGIHNLELPIQCKSTNDYYIWHQCIMDEGTYFFSGVNGTIYVSFTPKSTVFINPNNGTFSFSKSIGGNWTWVNQTPGSYGFSTPQPTYNETFQMFCDWWINTGGRPVSGAAKTVVDANCK